MTQRVLVVDDDPDVLALVVMVLGLAGHEVIEAADPDTAERILEGTSVDLVLTDLNFGTTTSLAAVRRWVEGGIPVIVMTAAAAEVDVPATLDQDVTLLRKPFSLDDLRAAVSGGLGT